MAKERWVIGQHAVEEALRTHPNWVKEFILFEGKSKELDQWTPLLSQARVKAQLRGKKFFHEFGEGHQGVAVSMTARPEFDESVLDHESCLLVFLDGLTDPHNLGAVLRTSWLLGAKALFIPKNRSVDLTPVVAKVASGGAEHVPIEPCHFVSQLEWLKEKGFWVYGLSEKATESLPEVRFAAKSVLVLGAEDKGVRSSTSPLCDLFISVPQVSSGPSFNASVAFAMCAYEWARQHRF